jgi:hypothetical protein
VIGRESDRERVIGRERGREGEESVRKSGEVVCAEGRPQGLRLDGGTGDGQARH